MESLKLDGNGDLVMEDGDMQIIGGLDEVVQNYQVLMRTNLNEWFLNPELGFDFSVVNGVKKINDDDLKIALQNVADQLDEIDYIENVQYEFDRSNRSVIISCEAVTVDGLTFNVREVL